MARADFKKLFERIGQDDQVEYFVFAPPTQPDISKFMLDVNAIAQDIIGDYMWNQEPFILRLPTKEDVQNFEEAMQKNISYVYGCTKFGDNVEDEWFIVNVLLEITRKFPGSVVRVVDNDGEFLLIEAADYLPDWAESDESCAQRVYICEGAVHLVPRQSGQLPDGVPAVTEAVEVVRKHSQDSKCGEDVQTCIRKRIGEYPKKMEENFHYTNLMIPPKLAAVLEAKPNLLPYGVATFYFRDPIDIKSARLYKTFKPREGLIKSRVKFTRCLFAMLQKQNFRPDPKSGWQFPAPSSSDFKAHALGAKLTLGFEILAARLIGSIGNPDHTDLFDDNAGWLRYEESLKKTGYFKDFMEGSKPYIELATKARSFFNDNLTDYVRLGHEDVMLRHFKNVYNTVPVDLERLKAKSGTLPPDDDESWMEMRSEDFDNLLVKHFNSQGSSLLSKEIPEKLKEFMNKISDFEGVELPDDPQAVHTTSSAKSKESKPIVAHSNGSTQPGENELDEMLEPLDFRADEFVSAMDKLLLDLGQRDQDWDASDDSYGSDDELDLNLEDIKHLRKDSKIVELMGQMDAELAGTEVGKTFTNPEVVPSTSFSGSGNANKKTAVEDLEEFDDVEAVDAFDIDMNTLSNMLESFRSQEGPSGPSANLLRSAGFKIDDIKQ